MMLLRKKDILEVGIQEVMAATIQVGGAVHIKVVIIRIREQLIIMVDTNIR